MEMHDVGPVYSAVFGLMAAWDVPPEGGVVIPLDNYEDLKRFAQLVVTETESLDTPIAHSKAVSVRDLLFSSGEDFKHPEKPGSFIKFDWRAVGKLRSRSRELNTSFRDEMSLKRMVIIHNKYRYLLENAEASFGVDVQGKFPSATYDIAEALRCLALGRSTASVFHSMRVAEIGLLAICRCLGIPDPVKPAERNWGYRLKKVGDEINTRWPSGAPRMQGDGEQFERLYSFLQAIQNPWRNATAHADQKYTEEEAAGIFNHTADLMKRIAGRMDEFGEPKA